MTKIKKAKKFFLGIRGKILIAMISLVAVTLLLVYFLGVVFLEKEYNSDKKTNVTDVLNSTIEELIDSEDNKIDNDFFINLSLKNDVCIDICNMNGISIYKYEGVGNNCFTHNRLNNKQQLISSVYGNMDKTTVTQIVDDKDKTNFFIAGQYLSTDTVDYIILTTASLNSVSDATNIVSKQLISISGILFIVATLIAIFLSGFITRPIKKLTVAVNKVADGNLDVSMAVNESKNGEFNKLSKSFNIMVSKIRRFEVMQKELIANVSHDLKTPLTMIKGYAELIKDITGDDKEKREEQLDIIIEETDRLGELVKDIMDLSLMQAGAKTINTSKFDIVKLITNVTQRFSYYVETYGVKFILDLPPSYMVVADELRIEQVLHNLINNAITHIGDDKILQITAVLNENNKLRIQIIDHGDGIKPDEITAIWDRYYKPYRTAKGENKGTGLGLSIVKANLIAHNFDFGVSSILHEGSNFWFEI